jgi:hypothetical protein
MRNLLKKLDMVTPEQIAAFVAEIQPRHQNRELFTVVTVGGNANSVPDLNFHWDQVAPVVGSVVEVEFGYYWKIVAVLDKKDSQ